MSLGTVCAGVFILLLLWALVDTVFEPCRRHRSR